MITLTNYPLTARLKFMLALLAYNITSLEEMRNNKTLEMRRAILMIITVALRHNYFIKEFEPRNTF